ncbi:MAG: hypothetical protein JST04_13045 [Bdellovibrionales bacterium]|nr:hypothetical protein [Bdellovibrionales bacterium]
MNRIGTLFQIGLKDPWYRANLILRLLVLTWVFTRGTALLGDSDYYLESMRSIWAGHWGGATFRAPMYPWMLAIFGGPIVTSATITLIIWLVGVDLSKKCGRLIGCLWLFDPVLLLLGAAVMSDALFALFVYASVIAFKAFLESPLGSQAIRLGLTVGAAILTRPIGIPFAALMAAFVLLRPERARIRGVFLAMMVAILLVTPRLIWNERNGAGWTIAEQGRTFQMAVAAAVYFAGSGLNYTEAENRWVAEHPEDSRESGLIRRTLVAKFPIWLKLSAKGVLRTLFGHVNVEAGSFLFGRPVVGPGWFSEGNRGPVWTLPEKAVWVLGMFAAALFALFEYLYLLRDLRRVSRSAPFWNGWLLLAIVGFVLAPQLFGDCRFRLPVLAVLFAARACLVSEKGLEQGL